MKKLFFAASLLLVNLAWAGSDFHLRVSKGEVTDTLVFSANYDDDIYSCYLELSELKVIGGEIRAVIDNVSPRRCMYIEAPDYGLINLSGLKLRRGLYKIFINNVEQGTLDAAVMELNKKEHSDPLDPEYF